ncbi:MAG TPA: cation diffusion facilitator family transporter [Pyrinomonadaceae bacterium]|nr:cation diffusion facilitator family transporter [Pyrinomonadaceae bacterium]
MEAGGTTEDRRFAVTPSETTAKRRAARLSIMVAGSLVLLKLATAWLTGSLSVVASLLDSAMDIIASLINFFAVRAASLPPDEDHRYGHGKAESLAGLFQAAVITASGIYLITRAVQRLYRPFETSSEWVGVGSMLVAAVASALLVMKLRAVSRETDSPALNADAAHYASDVFTNGAALVALFVVATTGFRLADPLISLVISAFILWSALGVARESIDVLMDRKLPPEVDEAVARVVGSFGPQGVVGFHDLRTRRSGALKFIDLHLEVEREQSLVEAHDLTVRVLRAIEAEIPRSRVQIHTDPAEKKNEGGRMKAAL